MATAGIGRRGSRKTNSGGGAPGGPEQADCHIRSPDRADFAGGRMKTGWVTDAGAGEGAGCCSYRCPSGVRRAPGLGHAPWLQAGRASPPARGHSRRGAQVSSSPCTRTHGHCENTTRTMGSFCRLRKGSAATVSPRSYEGGAHRTLRCLQISHLSRRPCQYAVTSPPVSQEAASNTVA